MHIYRNDHNSARFDGLKQFAHTARYIAHVVERVEAKYGVIRFRQGKIFPGRCMKGYPGIPGGLKMNQPGIVLQQGIYRIDAAAGQRYEYAGRTASEPGGAAIASNTPFSSPDMLPDPVFLNTFSTT